MKDEYRFKGGHRGAVRPQGPGKTRITIRLDTDVLDAFRSRAHDAGGANYQTLINEALRDYLASTAEPLDDRLRRIIREELAERSASQATPSDHPRGPQLPDPFRR
jgi:hypothetical protein